MKKLVVITGASSGIGEAIAIKLSSEGYPLLLLARRVDRMEALNLPNTMCRKVDVLDLEAFGSAIKEAEAKYGAVDCLVNNAGVMFLDESKDLTPHAYNQMVDINIKGVLNGMYLVLNDMVSRNHGTIINISSVAGRKAIANHSVYCGTKFAVHAISETARQEVASSNVRVSIVAPGRVVSEIIKNTTDETLVSNYKQLNSEIGALASEEIANAVSFIYNQPQRICIRELVMTSTKQNG